MTSGTPPPMVRRPCVVRPAGRADVPGLVELLCALFAIETDFAIRPALHAQGLRLLLRQSRGGACGVFVAELEGNMVGMATVQTVISTAEGARSGWIEDVVVVPHLRRAGIGKLLLEEIETWARERGVHRLQLLVDRRNDAALAFYDARGFIGTNMVCWCKRLPRGATDHGDSAR
jgi:GNAT superfamily N-acetyltransferase